MGNSITADSHPLVIDRLGEMGCAGHSATRPGTSTVRGAPLGSEDPRLNLKAWRFSGRYKVCCEGIDFLKERFTLDDSSTYLVMVLRKASRDESADASAESLSADASTSASSLYNTLPPTLTSVFTPRGLKFPFSSFNNEAGYQKTIYIFYGKRASALAKAKALKHGLDLEKVLEQGGAGPSLIAAGEPCELVDKQIVTAAAGSPSTSTSTSPAASAAAIHILGTLGPPPQAAAAASSAASSGAATPQATPVAAAGKPAPPIPGFKPAFSLNLSSLSRGGAAGGAGAGGGSGGLRMPVSGDPDSNRTLSASTTTTPPSSAHDTAALSSSGPRAGGRASSDERERFAAPAAAAAPVPTPPPVLDFSGLGASSVVPALSELAVPQVEVALLPVEQLGSRSPPSPPNDSFASAATQPVATAMPKLGFALKLPPRTAHAEADVEAEAAESHDTETSSCASSASDTEDASSDEKTEPKDPSPAWGGGGPPAVAVPTIGALAAAAASQSTATGPIDVREDEDEKLMYHRREAKMREASAVVSKVCPYLCVSGQQPVEELQSLLSSGVTDIVNTAEMVVQCKYPDYFEYYAVRMRDSPCENIMNYFPHCVAAVERARKKRGGCLLIHCHQGVSRSCTLIGAYLMWRDGLSQPEAIDKVREARGVARPNPGFLIRLDEWHRHLESPPTIAIHKLTPFSEECVLPPVLALQAPSERGVIDFDPKSCYAIFFFREKRVWLWQGRSASDTAVQVAMYLLPEIAQYAFKTSEQSGAYRRWPADVVAAPEVLKQGSREELELLRIFEENGLEADVSRSVQSKMPVWDSSLHTWLADRKAAAADPAETTRRQRRDGTGGVLSSQLLMEQLDVKDLFVLNEDSPGFTMDGVYREHGLDEEDLVTFQETMENRAAVFLKLRGDHRMAEVWLGELYVDADDDEINEAAAQEAAKVMDAFQRWSRVVCCPFPCFVLFLLRTNTTQHTEHLLGPARRLGECEGGSPRRQPGRGHGPEVLVAVGEFLSTATKQPPGLLTATGRSFIRLSVLSSLVVPDSLSPK